jgi:hypothetical protein
VGVDDVEPRMLEEILDAEHGPIPRCLHLVLPDVP